MMKDNYHSSFTEVEEPVFLQDIQLIEKLARFDRERIPERVVYAKGTGAHGFFRVYMPMSDYTSAAFLQNPDKRIPVFTRFSTFTGSKGSADTLRDPRGFSVKFYTTEGNYDLLSNNLPVFFIRDAIKFPDLVHSLKPAPDTNITDPERFWKFISDTPEATHMITWLFSDRGTVKSYRHMEGYSVNTYIWASPKGKRYFVKYLWKPLLAIKDITRQEAEFLAGFDSDVCTRDLNDSFERGEVTEYELSVQLIPHEDQYKFNFDIFDATKLWPEEQIPIIKVGKMTLNKASENYFEEVEQAAFSPANTVSGIELSNDKLLQGMVFSSKDSQRHRLGTNFALLPINKPKFTVTSCHQEGYNKYPTVKTNTEEVLQRNEIIIDDFSQAGDRYRSLSKREQDHLVDNIIENMMFVDDNIQEKVVGYFKKADEEFGNRVSMGLDF